MESLFLYLSNKNKKTLYDSLKYYFIVYIFLLIYALFLDGNLNILNFSNWFGHLSLSNIIPFSNTIKMVKDIFSYGNFESLSIILGNIIMLSPLSFFIPRLFDRVKSFKSFLIVIFFVTFLIELIQLATDTGYFDIDDILLNVAGALFFYYLFNKTFFKKILDNLLFFDNSTITIKEILYSVLLVLMILYLFIISIKEYYSDPVGSYMNILCEKDTCLGDNTLIFDDGNYLYYVKDDCLNSLYIDFKTDKYLLKDYLQGAGRKVYHNYYSMADIQFRCSEYISKKNKYYESSISFPKREIAIEYVTDNNIMEVESFDSYITQSEYTDYYRLKGKEEGNVTLKIVIKDYFNQEEIIKTIERQYFVDKNMNVVEK